MKQVLLIFLIVFSTFTVFAQTDDEGNPNDPTVNENANACYNGGEMEGKCNVDVDGDGTVEYYEVQWAWECGWYMIRYDYDLISREEIPVRCDSLLPADVPPADRTGENAPTCYTNGDESFIVTGPLNTYLNYIAFNSPDCMTNQYQDGAPTLITAENAAQAEEICHDMFYFGTPWRLVDYGFNTPSNWYICQ